MSEFPFSVLDSVALAWFLLGWFGYQQFSAWAARSGRPSLMGAMGQYRKDWWRGMIDRELRIVDATILMNLSNPRGRRYSPLLILCSIRFMSSAADVSSRRQNMILLPSRAVSPIATSLLVGSMPTRLRTR